MKLDEKYFLEKMHDVLMNFGEPATAIWLGIVPILEQIAADARREQAGKIMDYLNKTLRHLRVTNNPSALSFTNHVADVKDLLAAIESATVKWEVPGE